MDAGNNAAQSLPRKTKVAAGCDVSRRSFDGPIDSNGPSVAKIPAVTDHFVTRTPLTIADANIEGIELRAELCHPLRSPGPVVRVLAAGDHSVWLDRDAVVALRDYLTAAVEVM